ncbi:NADPH-dependent oxidoreductase [Paenibacillus sp. 79R4]|uniref:NADPH-dependent oxidoreductase n=1 Tax=Paenibacillus sp. 79R4 TaxID=2212847 RepID=UPI0015B7EB8A|nr:NADPH-dependent oxidoreductase [Paenibacillus sp. 79R4]NWL86061.1 NADPH-dependent oxidoreductase [Paenibacillus sp. 79R4]
MNDVIQIIHKHRSIRKFKNIPLTDEQIQPIVDAAQMAPTSANMQPFSIIGITDQDLRRKIATRSDNPWIETCGYFFVFCADLHRMRLAAGPDQQEKMNHNLSFSYFYQTSVLSTALALQNANLTAESMGLGAVIIGGITGALPELDEWLGLPDFVIPLVGLAVGVPDEFPEQKPRLPRSAVFFENQYNHDLKSQIEKYDQEIEEYYGARTNNKQKTSWSGKFISMLDRDLPLGGYTEYVRSKGFDLR